LTQLVQGNMAELRVLRRQRDALDDQIQRLERQLRKATGFDPEVARG